MKNKKLFHNVKILILKFLLKVQGKPQEHITTMLQIIVIFDFFVSKTINYVSSGHKRKI